MQCSAPRNLLYQIRLQPLQHKRCILHLDLPVEQFDLSPLHLLQQIPMGAQLWKHFQAVVDATFEKAFESIGQQLKRGLGVSHWLHSWIGGSWTDESRPLPSSERAY